MNRHIIALILVLVMAANILLLSGCDRQDPPVSTPPVTTVPSTTVPTTTQTPETTVPPTTTPPTTVSPTTVPPTTVPPTTAPPVTVPPTTPPVNNAEMIGSVYTRGQLMAMENENKGYGPGTSRDGKRAPYAEGNQAAYGNYGANFIAPDNGNIYLTFDCGYEYTIKENGKDVRLTEKILDVLKEKNVKAVFFVTMYYCTQSPDLIQRMIDEGHAVGNHTNNHPAMPTISLDKMVYEVMSLHEYVETNFGYKMTLFRPPEGAFSTRSLALVQSLGYKTVHWSFAYADWDTANQPDHAKALTNIVSSGHSGAIYLLHAVSATNAAVLGDAIDGFIANGYKLELFQ
ncbi:MAG: polysaccharide deacetylase family protein [Oscillospiraceae bacterium]|nr:polysaccharide deacetylase family protein [Oscillospiraceae bacterium]